ncbi:MAG: hypothetical protein K9N23_23410 [Akkermansiaceae bacterium]|nr:hypothetical protein [Akkermansiaceae bacterium]
MSGSSPASTSPIRIPGHRIPITDQYVDQHVDHHVDRYVGHRIRIRIPGHRIPHLVLVDKKTATPFRGWRLA